MSEFAQSLDHYTPARHGGHRKASFTGKATTAASSAPYLSEHPDYVENIHRWKLLRAVLGGSTEVKAMGTILLPSLHDQVADDYHRYKARALFVAFTGRTLAALVGLLMRKSPEIKHADALAKFMADVDTQGTSFNDYVRLVCEEMNGPGHGGTLIDWSTEEARPYFCHYCTEDVINWDVRRVNGRNVLSLVTLKEEGYALNPVTLEHDEQTNYRTFRLTDKGTVEMTEATTLSGAQQNTSAVELKRRGKPLTAIPFIFHTLKGNKAGICKSPLEDMAVINVSHYCTSADLENGRHVAGLPTPYAFGFDTKEELTMGTTHAWISDNTDAKVGFLEYMGNGLNDLKEALREKQEQMAVMGARMIEPEKKEAEAFSTVKLRADAEQATLVNVAEAASATLSLCMQWAAWWDGTAATPADEAEKNYIVLPTDFVAARMDSATFTSLVAAFQIGGISWPTFFYNLQQGEIYPDNWTKEDEESAMEQAPVLTPPRNPEAERQAAALAAAKGDPPAKPAADPAPPAK